MVVMMMMMYNQDYVNDLIEFDQMDVDVYDVIHLEMVVENKVVENHFHLNLMMFDYLIYQNYLIHL
jgi:hypothetical protein